MNGPMLEMLELVCAAPENHIHVTDLPYRLASPACQSPENVRLWREDAGELAAWAVWQQPFGTLDYACRPEQEAQRTEAIFQWTEARLTTLARERGAAVFCCVMPRERDTVRRAFLERHGFRRLNGGHLRMERALHDPVPDPILPEGFAVRPLAGAAEAEAYTALHRAAFGSENMTVEWRGRTLLAPAYVPALDLVAVAPDGRLAAFCIGWLDPAPVSGVRRAQVEPLGVHPEFQRLGLGRALLTACLRQMQAHGAETAIVSPDDSEDGQRVYRAVGFRPVAAECSYGREFASDGKNVA